MFWALTLSAPFNDVIPYDIIKMAQREIGRTSDISWQNVSTPSWYKAGLVLCVSLHSLGKPIDFQVCVGGGDRLRGCFISL